MLPKEKKKSYKYCIVPGCKTTTRISPDKRFLILPQERKRRNAWLRASRIDTNFYGHNTRVYLCEDHFNFEEDAENYIRMQYHSGNRIVLKPDVIPHIFECQPDRTAAQKPKGRPTSAKRARRSLVEGILQSADFEGNEPPPTEAVPPVRSSLRLSLHKPTTPPATDETSATQVEVEVENVENTASHIPGLKASVTKKTNQVDKGVQVKPHQSEKSVQVQHKVDNRSKFIQCDFLRVETQDAATSPMKNQAASEEQCHFDSCNNACSSADPSSPSTKSGTTTPPAVSKSPALSGFEVSTDIQGDSELVYNNPQVKRDLHIRAIKKDPMHFLGMPPDLYFLVDVFADCVGCQPMHILIILQKIRQDRPFKSIGFDFEVSESYASETFCHYVSKLSKCLKAFIMWPSKEKILSRLPLPFRTRYYSVQSIIDCFEIEIQKPSDPVHQTLTFSNYKRWNTIKYEISMTPDGLINDISGGFGGRTSDCKMVELCGFLDKLPSNCAVVAGKQFEGIALILEKKRCTLIGTPSVRSDEKRTKGEVRESKQIASPRIDTARVVRRVQQFQFVRAHACVNHNLVKYLDCVVVIVCGLVNLQNPSTNTFFV